MSSLDAGASTPNARRDGCCYRDFESAAVLIRAEMGIGRCMDGGYLENELIHWSPGGWVRLHKTTRAGPSRSTSRCAVSAASRHTPGAEPCGPASGAPPPVLDEGISTGTAVVVCGNGRRHPPDDDTLDRGAVFPPHGAPAGVLARRPNSAHRVWRGLVP